MSDTTMIKQILLTQQSSAYSRVTSNHPPMNIFGPETIPQLNEGSGTEKSSIAHWYEGGLRRQGRE